MVDSASAFAAKLHSRYQPKAEADRYIGSLNIRPGVDWFIFIEPGLGYLVHALRKLRPGSRAVVLHADSRFRETGAACPGVPAWYPDSGMGVQEFLEREIPETADVQIVEWKPSVGVFGECCARLVRESAAFVRRAAASRRTGAAFGRRWLRNFFRNLNLLQSTVLYKTMDAPVVVTGSGPSLEAALPKIIACREGLFVIAASSSLPALAVGGLVPDMVISTDGGGWALLHLHACFRRQGLPVPTKLALGLTAAIPSQCSGIPVLPISDGSLWQNIALSAAGIPSALVPQRGTVTASALELAMALTGGDIFLAGMDLSVCDIQSHARPYGFDHLFFGSASRFRPLYSQYFMRSNDIRSGGSHEVYAGWFGSRIASLPRRIFSLGNNHAVLANGLPAKDLAAGGQGGGVFAPAPLKGSPADRCRLALNALVAALGAEQYAGTLVGELAPLLFPSQQQAAAGEIAESLRDIAARYLGAAGG